MNPLNSASYTSISRGYDYAIGGHVLSVEKVDDVSYNGLVKGSHPEPYKVHIDVEHVRKSKCDCPFTEGNRKICKHMIALFFTVFPDQLKTYQVMVRDAQEIAEFERLEAEKKLYKYINKLKKQELRDILIELLECGPEWQYDKFIRDYVEFFEGYEDYDFSDVDDMDMDDGLDQSMEQEDRI